MTVFIQNEEAYKELTTGWHQFKHIKVSSYVLRGFEREAISAKHLKKKGLQAMAGVK